MPTVATWNVNSIRIRQDHFKNWVHERQPDVILLQELKCIEQDFPRVMAHDLGYNFAVHGQKSYNGVAILAKSPINDVTRGLRGFEDENARYIEAEIDGAIYASVYVPNGQEVGCDKYDYKLAFMEALTKHVSPYCDLDQVTIIGGDYNIAPFPQDGHTPSRFDENRILISMLERQSLHRLMNRGFKDALRHLHPYDLQGEGQEGLFTWWDYRAGSFENNRGYRIDHLMISPFTCDKIKAAGVDHETRAALKPSDHAPVWLSWE